MTCSTALLWKCVKRKSNRRARVQQSNRVRNVLMHVDVLENRWHDACVERVHGDEDIDTDVEFSLPREFPN